MKIKNNQKGRNRDYVRFNWRLDANGNPKLLEVIPKFGVVLGWASHKNDRIKIFKINPSNGWQ